MFYYISSTCFFFVLSLLSSIKSPRLGIVLGLCPMIFLALLRGSVGADTAVYVQSIEQIINAGSYTGLFEPLFEVLVLLLGVMSTNAQLILASIGAIITIILLRVIIKRQVHPLIFCLFIIPVYYFDMVMNGVRYGLSFSLVLMASAYLVNNKEKNFFVLVLLASLFQVSGGILGALFYLLYARKWKFIFYFGVLGSAIGFVFSDYLSAKLSSYADIQISSVFSGGSTVLVSVCLLALWVLDPSARKQTKLAVSLLFLLVGAMFGLSQISYAGIRFLQLINFLILMYLSAFLMTGKVSLSRVTKLGFVVIAVMAWMFRMKNFSDGGGEGPSPFVPYLFFWE